MRESVALNDAVRLYPFASARYQRVFNQKAEELGLDFRWQQDTVDFNSIEPGGSLGQHDEFTAFGRSVIQSIPDGLEAQILKAQGEYRPYFIDHQVDFPTAN
jgi:hypothetical protein